ncbi:hypothetical protein [Thermogymnomonas acidicola]|uniref:alpha-amylase family glycosyl hydrolase n=1 Tax=Thermogymnomonas acidicola TaxID=399579 RepID=UPI0009465A54|nr:alpha-amylase family glycosyl hydrolase [Thermogymnomonas acidicola]
MPFSNLRKLHFDSLTNYHVRRLILDYVRGGRIGGAADLVRGVTSECILYGQNEDRMMNILDSHDTVRLMTTLRGDRDRFMLAYTLLFILNGLATIYYGGDETGLRGGGRDPDCRRTMPWDEMDQELVRFFRELGSLRGGHYRAARTGILECEERHGVDTILKKSGGDSALRLYVFRSPGGAGVRIQGEPVLWNGAIQDVGGLWKGVASGFVLSAEG